MSGNCRDVCVTGVISLVWASRSLRTGFLALYGSAPSDHVMLGGYEDQWDLFVSSSKQRKHPFTELVGSGKAVDLRARLHVVEGHLTLVHVHEHAHLTQLWWSLHLHIFSFCQKRFCEKNFSFTEKQHADLRLQ